MDIQQYLSEFYFSLNNFSLILLYIFLGNLIIQLFYYIFFYTRLAFYNKTKIEINKTPVSIVICAQNENESLKNFLPDILEQNYPAFEVIVVNDCSTDESAQTLYEFSQQYSHLYYTNIPFDNKFKHNKKLALTLGIKAAKNDWILFTDADCKPDSKFWLNKMQRNFCENTNFVLGYGGYFRESKLVNWFIRYDTVSIASQYLSFALAGIPYKGVGRNMAYKKSFFLKNKGFSQRNQIKSSDDDLFVNQNAKRRTTKIEINRESFTYSVPKHTFKEWFRQKQRHLATAKYYKFRDKLLLVFEPISRVLYYVSFALLLKYVKMYEAVLALFLFRFILQHIIYIKTFFKLNEKNLSFFILIFDILMPFINIYLLLSKAFFKTKNTWR